MHKSEQDIRNRLLLARLPAMPQILLKLLELCQSDRAGMAELAKLLAYDAGMTAKVLKVANSAAYQRGGQKVELVSALSALGADMIKMLVVSESVLQTLGSFPHCANRDLRQFWWHALTTAVIARDIARAMGYAQSEEAYLAGLLHDVGRLALLAAAPEEYGVTFHVEDDQNLCAVEQRNLQISHAEAGAWLVERWNLDSFMADAVLYHHESPARVEGAHPLIRLLHLANQLAGHDPAMPIASDAGYLCQLPGESLLAISRGAAAQVTKAAAFLGIDLSGMEQAALALQAKAPVVDGLQQRMSEEISHMALMAELGQSFARQQDDAQLLKVVRQNAHILFQLDDTIILLMNGNGQSLLGVSVGEQRQRLADFSLSLAAGGGLAESARQLRVAFLGHQGSLLNVAEEQLLRVFGAQCLVSVPLVLGPRCLGLLVGGVPAWRVSELQGRERYLQAFANLAASALDAAKRERGEIDKRIAAVREEHRESSRRVLHEVNNPLAIIKNYLGVLDEKLSRQEPVSGELSVLQEEIDRVGSIMQEFAGNAPPRPSDRAEINRIVSKLVRLFRESKFLPPGVEIVSRLPQQDCEIDGAGDTLKQILVNLIKNSVEVLPRGGRIEIVNQGAVQREGRSMFSLCVKDNGPGIPAEQRSRLFSPVQSTKAGSNRGIGLSIVHGLVKQLGGSIQCESSASGTQFEICLPLAAAHSSAALPAYLHDRG
jgi:putative nucleotidyltransferase with HDIG domain